MSLLNRRILKYFLYNNQLVMYNKIPYNNASERCVEIPIAVQFLQNTAPGGRVLEVGHVLSHYGVVNTLPGIRQINIIDKFEVSPGVLNVDLMDYAEKHDVIVCISTVEHVGQNGYGEFGTGDREAPLKAIVKLYNLLAPGGKALITVPFGKLTDLGWLIQFSSDYLSLLTRKYGIPESVVKLSFLKKVDTEIGLEAPGQNWIQCKDTELIAADFHSPFYCANGIAVIVLEKRGGDVPIVEVPPEPLVYHRPVVIGDLYYTPFRKPLPPDSDGWFYARRSGFVFYGPYVSLPPQTYLFHIRLEIEGGGHFTLDLASNSGNKILWRQEIHHSVEISQAFTLHGTETQAEIRLFKNNKSDCRVRVPHLSMTALS